MKGPQLLAEIPPEDLRRDCPTARIVAVRHRGTIYRQGEPARTIYFVLEGQVTIARGNDADRNYCRWRVDLALPGHSIYMERNAADLNGKVYAFELN